MQHTIAAIFDQYTQAQHALEDVTAAGIPRDKVRLNQKDQSATASIAGSTAGTASGTTMGTRSAARHEDDDSFGAEIRNFFASLFGADDHNDAELYSEALRRGSYVLTVEVDDDSQLDRITDAIAHNNPIDIEDRASQWQSGGWAAQSSMRNKAPARGAASSFQEASGSSGQRTDMLQGARPNSLQREATDSQQRIPVIQEQMQSGNREVGRGGVRVYRRPIEQPAMIADRGALKQGSSEMRESKEDPVIQKAAHVIEEVTIGTETAQRTEQINESARHTEAGAGKLSGQSPAQDKERYRRHFDSTYGQSGRPYEEYLPAYQYGSSLAGDQRYSGRKWDEVETDARTDWETRNPRSAWENFKAAVRHGWDEITR